jgi:ABC-type nitrate/sulfonate/bicarbonate transport system substrate-binding protein
MTTVRLHGRRAFRAAVIAGITAVLAVSAACSSDDSGSGDGGLTPFAFQTSWIPIVEFGGSYVAHHEGYYKKNGLDVTILPGGPEVDNMSAVVSGQADIGLGSADQVAKANANDAGLVIVAAGFQKNPLCILSSPANPIKTPSDLEGKKIGIPSGDTANHDAFVEANHLAAGKISTVPVGFDVAPLVSGEVNGLYAFYSEQPVAYEKATGKAGVTMLAADYGLDVYSEVYVVKKDTLADPDKKASVESFLKGEIQGWQDYVADPTKAVELTVNVYAKDGGLTIEQQTKQAKLQMDLVVTDETRAHGLFWMSDDGIQKNLTTLAALNIPADASLFDTSLLSDIYQGKNTIG